MFDSGLALRGTGWLCVKGGRLGASGKVVRELGSGLRLIGCCPLAVGSGLRDVRSIGPEGARGGTDRSLGTGCDWVLREEGRKLSGGSEVGRVSVPETMRWAEINPMPRVSRST